jgi:hypothetical protein
MMRKVLMFLSMQILGEAIILGHDPELQDYANRRVIELINNAEIDTIKETECFIEGIESFIDICHPKLNEEEFNELAALIESKWLDYKEQQKKRKPYYSEKLQQCAEYRNKKKIKFFKDKIINILSIALLIKNYTFHQEP